MSHFLSWLSITRLSPQDGHLVHAGPGNVSFLDRVDCGRRDAIDSLLLRWSVNPLLSWGKGIYWSGHRVQQFGVIQWSGIKKMEVTVVVVRSSIACVAVVSVFSNLAKRPGSVEDGRSARVGAKKGTLRIFRVFFFSRFQKETRMTASQARSLIVGSLGN